MASELLLANEKVINQQHWESKSPINDRLRSILAPVADQFNHEAIAAIRRGHYGLNPEYIKYAGIVHTLPYGRLEALPPAIFGNITENDISLDEDLVIPTDDEEIERLADKYVAWGDRTIHNPRYIASAYTPRPLVVLGLQRCKGETYAQEKWQASACQLQQSMLNDSMFLLDFARTNRLQNASSDYDQLYDEHKITHRPYEAAVVAMSKLYPGDGMVSNTKEVIQIPIGEYGEESAKKLAQVTLVLNDYLKTSKALEMGIRYHLDAGDKELLAEHTARSRDRHSENMPDFEVHGIKNTLAEGILSMSQVIAMFTAEKVDGFDTHDELVAAILDSDVIEQFTRLVRPGYIGPTTLAGIYLKDTLTVKDGKVSLSKDTIDLLNGLRKEYRKERVAMWALHDAAPDVYEAPPVLGLPCPAANPKGSITTLKSVFKEYYSTEK